RRTAPFTLSLPDALPIFGRDLALRVYTTRLLGRDPHLVLHGGGNTSVKTTMPDLLGEAVDAICVKGSGADMATIEPAGLPALRLDRKSTRLNSSHQIISY